MLPTLAPGDFVIGAQSDLIGPADIVAFEHPELRDFWLVKRVLALDGEVDLDAGTVNGAGYVDAFRNGPTDRGRFAIPDGSMFVLSDNRKSTLADSRMFGAIPTVGAYRIRLRYWPMAQLRRF